MLGVADVDAEWTKFKAHHAAAGKANTLRGWRGLFTGKWCVDAKKFASAEKTRGGPRQARIPQPIPEGGRAWKPGL
jgi:hypothetical protein